MPDPIHLVPLFEIDAEALARDRTSHDEPALLELRLSIATSGLRMPIEVFPLAEPYPPFRYGLISGFRRLAAFRALYDLTGQDKYATIPAFLRAPETLAHAITAMVEENAIRVEISPWERAAIAMRSARAGLYPGIDAAVDAIYLNLTRARRARIRAIAHLADELDGHLTPPRPSPSASSSASPRSSPAASATSSAPRSPRPRARKPSGAPSSPSSSKPSAPPTPTPTPPAAGAPAATSTSPAPA